MTKKHVFYEVGTIHAYISLIIIFVFRIIRIFFQRIIFGEKAAHFRLVISKDKPERAKACVVKCIIPTLIKHNWKKVSAIWTFYFEKIQDKSRKILHYLRHQMCRFYNNQGPSLPYAFNCNFLGVISWIAQVLRTCKSIEKSSSVDTSPLLPSTFIQNSHSTLIKYWHW